MVVEITQAQLFEIMGRLYAEVQAVNVENTRLKALLAQPQQSVEKKPKGKGSG